MHEEGVGDAAQALNGFAVVDGDGFFTEVGGGHDEGRNLAGGEEEVLERGVGEEDAEPGNAGGYSLSDLTFWLLAGDYDGAR